MSFSSDIKNGNTSNQRFIGQKSSSRLVPRSICPFVGWQYSSDVQPDKYGTIFLGSYLYRIVLRCNNNSSRKLTKTQLDFCCCRRHSMAYDTTHSVNTSVSIKSFVVYNGQSCLEIAKVSIVSCALPARKIPSSVSMHLEMRLSILCYTEYQ